ncbi:peptide chain release factor N(5)-glutamine methyltransferase [Sedimentimonas flavescens]|uniref:peptide chain release factor N(5)-glutamine methyltransferase n=1 Tax=Sedimentimonas flavescens TaxID=2851012 RepID=UPI0021A5BC63|nr:peptide chain release factor N(5)-glutamine methyltransferase [Sedimentimonas flavescens]MCT2540662.1 peptide chain release factor N(5)-glutamine methyltransferase [Sedimentimonas flavescens]
MKAQAALVHGTRRLVAAGIEGAALDARRLMAHALNEAPDRLTLRLQDDLTETERAAFDRAITAREARQPVAQITGRRLFWGQEFRVTRDTLDPRPETEILVAAALEEPFAKVLDLGTGTGCILISCLKGMPFAVGTGTDVSPGALAVAQDNATRLGVEKRTRFAVSDWFAAINGVFDLIVSNPPYIAQDEMAGLSVDVREWEPLGALTPGGDGLDAYRAIARGAAPRLMPGGRVLLEIGPTQAQQVSDLLAAQGLERVEVRQDLDGRDRVVIARKPLEDGGCGCA